MLIVGFLPTLSAGHLAAQQCLYFTNQLLGSVRFIDTDDLARLNPLVGEIRGPDCSPQTIACQPLNLAFGPDQSTLYYTDVAAGALSVIDVGSNRVVATIPVGPTPQDVAVSSAGVVYVSVYAADEIAVVDPSSRTVVDHIAVGNQPRGVAFSPDGSTAYVAVTGAPAEVAVIDVAAGEVVDRVAVDVAPFGVATAPDGTVYVSNQAGRELIPGMPTKRQPTVSVIATPANEVVATIDVENGPAGLAVAPDGAEVYVANLNVNSQGPGAVTIIDRASNTVVGSVTVGRVPLAVAFSPDGAKAYVANVSSFSNNISIVDTAGRTAVNPSNPIGAGINDLAVGNFPCAEIPTPTATPTSTRTPSPMSTPTATGTSTSTATHTPGPSPTVTPTAEASSTPTATPSLPRETVTGTPSSTPTPTAGSTETATQTPAPECTGDCDGDGMITTGEVIQGVNIGLGRMSLDLCAPLDADGNQRVTIDELIGAVANAMGQCV